MGRVGALAAALALAISPTLVYSARYGDGATLLLLCAFGALALWLAYQRESGRQAYLYAIAVLAALALLADLRVVGLVIVGLVAWAIERFVFGRDLFELRHADEPLPWRDLALCFGGTFVLVATALAFNPGGLGAWADMLSAWFGHLAPVVNGQPWYYPLLALALYEPFVLLFGLIGGVTLLVQRKELDERARSDALCLAGGWAGRAGALGRGAWGGRRGVDLRAAGLAGRVGRGAAGGSVGARASFWPGTVCWPRSCW